MSAPPRDRDAYARFTEYRTRWLDNDQFGHLNNVHHYSFFDSAINATLIGEFGFDPGEDPTVFYVAQTGCTFHAGLSYPAIVEIGVRLARLGRSSVTYEVGVFEQGAPLAAATGHFVHVQVDRASERPVPLDAARRAQFARVYGRTDEPGGSGESSVPNGPSAAAPDGPPPAPPA
ncbi:MAG: thioesterase family protein [Patulibacter sp.]